MTQTMFKYWNLVIIHDDISLMQSVIPGLTKPAPYLIRGNPVVFPPGQAPPRKGSCPGGRPSWAGGWIPAGVYPALDAGRE